MDSLDVGRGCHAGRIAQMYGCCPEVARGVTVQTRGDGLGGGTFANDENETAPEGGLQTRHYAKSATHRKAGHKSGPTPGRPRTGRRVSNPPLRQVGHAPEGGLQIRPYARSATHRKAGCKPATTPARPRTGRRVANPALRQVGHAPEGGSQIRPYAKSATHRKAGRKPATTPSRPGTGRRVANPPLRQVGHAPEGGLQIRPYARSAKVILRETLNSYRFRDRRWFGPYLPGLPISVGVDGRGLRRRYAGCTFSPRVRDIRRR